MGIMIPMTLRESHSLPGGKVSYGIPTAHSHYETRRNIWTYSNDQIEPSLDTAFVKDLEVWL